MAKSGGAVDGSIEQQLIDYLRQTPKAVAVLIFSFFSGQLWVFIIIAYLKKTTKGNKLLNSIHGKTALGLFWFTLVLIPIYYIREPLKTA
jgi:hypothetical protein